MVEHRMGRQRSSSRHIQNSRLKMLDYSYMYLVYRVSFISLYLKKIWGFGVLGFWDFGVIDPHKYYEFGILG